MIIQLIIIQIITFAGLVFILRKIMITSSYGETQRLQELNKENTAKAQELAAQKMSVVTGGMNIPGLS